MTKGSSINAIEKTTGITWDKWVALLNKAGAKDLKHRPIADLAYAELKDKLENAGWWAQSVAVAYEQHIGRRKPGQQSNGSFEMTAGKTLSGSLNDAMQLWTSFVKATKAFDGVVAAKPATTSSTEKYRHWACNLNNGTRLNADVYVTNSGKVSLVITHAKLASQEDQARWKTYWQATLKTI